MKMKTKKMGMNEEMVTKWSVKNPLTIDERRKILEALSLNMSYSQMALHVGRSKSACIRESKRLGETSDYDPDRAQSHFEGIQLSRRKNRSETKNVD